MSEEQQSAEYARLDNASMEDFRNVAREAVEQRRRAERAEAWLREVTEVEWSEPCRFDHHGDCQAHGYDAPCPIPLIAAHLSSRPASDGSGDRG